MQFTADVTRQLGATLARTGCRFRVWVPRAESVEVHIVAPDEQIVAMARDHLGYWQAAVPDIGAGARYC